MISHIMFADDLIVFSKGTPLAAANLHALLNHFSWFSGLGVNWAKSFVFFSDYPEEDKCAIFSMLNVVEGKLPVRYLGVPLSSRKLSFQDCYPLVEKVNKRLSGWVEIKDAVFCRPSGVY